MKQSYMPFNNEPGQHRVRTMHLFWPDGRGLSVTMVFLHRPWAATMTVWFIDQTIFWTDPRLPGLRNSISRPIPFRLSKGGHAYGMTWRILQLVAFLGKFMKEIHLSGAVPNYSRDVDTSSWSPTSRTTIIGIRLRSFSKLFGLDLASWILPSPSRGLQLAPRPSESWSRLDSIPLAPPHIGATFTTMGSWSLASGWILRMATSYKSRGFLHLLQGARVKKTAHCLSVAYVLPLLRLPRPIQPLGMTQPPSLRVMRRRKNIPNWSISIDQEQALDDPHMSLPWSRQDQEPGEPRFSQHGHYYWWCLVQGLGRAHGPTYGFASGVAGGPALATACIISSCGSTSPSCSWASPGCVGFATVVRPASTVLCHGSQWSSLASFKHYLSTSWWLCPHSDRWCSRQLFGDPSGASL